MHERNGCEWYKSAATGVITTAQRADASDQQQPEQAQLRALLLATHCSFEARERQGGQSTRRKKRSHVEQVRVGQTPGSRVAITAKHRGASLVQHHAVQSTATPSSAVAPTKDTRLLNLERLTSASSFGATGSIEEQLYTGAYVRLALMT